MTPEPEVWMTPEEATAAAAFYRALQQECVVHNLPASPLVDLRIQGIFVYALLLRRLEASFLAETPRTLDKRHTDLIRVAARMHENLRRAIAEFERILRPPTRKPASAELPTTDAALLPASTRPTPDHRDAQIADNSPSPAPTAAPAPPTGPAPDTGATSATASNLPLKSSSTRPLPPPPNISRHLRNVPWQPPSRRR